MQKSVARTVVAGFCGGLALNLAMLVTFRLIGFGWDGGGILLDPAVQSRKLIAVWTEIEPLPMVFANPIPILGGLILFGIGHAFVYRWLSPAWPSGVVSRTIRFAALVFFLTYVFWEFFTPINQFGEPLWLVGLELVFWAVVALAEGIAIATVMESGRS